MTARFRVASFEHARCGRRKFDKVVAVNVNLFWTQPGVGVSKLRRLLSQTGAMYLIYEAPASMRPQRVAPIIEQSLRAEGFTDVELRSAKLHSAAAICIIAKVGRGAGSDRTEAARSR